MNALLPLLAYAFPHLCAFRYQAQVSYLSNILRSVFGQSLEIGTVDGMQGREKEAVILSLVRSNEEVRFSRPAGLNIHLTEWKREVGFLKDNRRLNGV